MEPPELTEDEFHRFQNLIYAQSGIRVPTMKRILLGNRIRRRLRQTGSTTFVEYLRGLETGSNAHELEHFLNEVTTNETFFHRTQEHFDWFGTGFLPALTREALTEGRTKSLRVWSAACSTGEEVYSLAICIAEHSLRLTGWAIDILGTDLSSEAVRQAQSGIYQSRAVEELLEKQRRRYFRHHETSDTWEVTDRLREHVEFRQHNLMKPLRDAPFDVVFLRNVLIYFDQESKQQVLTNVLEAMKPGGYLVVGPSEGVFGMLPELERLETYLYRRPAAADDPD